MPSDYNQAMQNTPVQTIEHSSGIDPILLAARNFVIHGELDKALHSYQHLIRRGRQINEVLADLAQLVKQYPRNPQVWQTLGDALSRSGDAAHAAQAYDQARKLTG
jgi:cytochrome c-type biogenesis protein CcmH/NrfG